MSERNQSLGEEIANSVSHGVGLLATLAAIPSFLASASRRAEPLALLGATVFAATLVLLFSASTLYHALKAGKAKRVFRVLDHSAVFLLIAGTYTPFTLGALRGPWGWTLLGLVWSLAAFGIVLTALAAALLNAARTDMTYPLTAAQIIAAVQAAYASGDFGPLLAQLDAANNAGCPLR